MSKPSREAYDVIIIGAGIGGLVCGCYLAKAGMKVLICEQHHKPGGYCTSFKRQGFTFDAAAHSFGGLKNGSMGRIIRDLHLDKKIKIKRFDPSDTVISSDYKFSFWADVEKTIVNLQDMFPDEADNLHKFFNFMNSYEAFSFARIRSLTFQDLLRRYFTDTRLMTLLSLPLYGNGGLPPSQMSAFIGAAIFNEFLLDGGYYPVGGMQFLADALASVIREFGGELQLSCSVKKIIVKDSGVTGVVLKDSSVIPSRIVVSNCDARQTFLNLIGKELLERAFLHRLITMTPALSTFVLYLGFESFEPFPDKGNIWVLSNYELDQIYSSAVRGIPNDIDGYLIHASPENKTITCYLNVAYKSPDFWARHKNVLADTLIECIDRDVMSGIKKHISFKGSASPYTLYRYTLNYRGASYGWACTPAQLGDRDFKRPSFLRGLYLVGHWTTGGLGIPGVAFQGYSTAVNILRKMGVSTEVLHPMKKSLQDGAIYSNFIK